MEEQKKTQVVNAYPGNRWADKVASMSENQLLAVYFRLKNQGKVV